MVGIEIVSVAHQCVVSTTAHGAVTGPLLVIEIIDYLLHTYFLYGKN